MAQMLDPVYVDPEEASPPISINPNAEPQEAPPLIAQEPVGGKTPIISDPDLSRRSFRIRYGLDTIVKKSYDEIYSDLKGGNEDVMRQEAAAEVDARKRIATEGAISQLAKNKGTKLTPEEGAGLRNLIMGMDKKTNPATVFEEAYGKKYISILDDIAARNEESQWNDTKNIPRETEAIKDVGSSLVTKKEIVRTQLENVKEEIKQQGWAPWLADQAKYAIPGYSNVKMRGNVKTDGFDPRLGEAMDEQRKELFRLPLEDNVFADKVTAIANDLKKDSPTAAKDFLEAMMGMSSDDIFVKNMNIVVDTLGLNLIKPAKEIAGAIANTVRGRGKIVAGKEIPESLRKAVDEAVDTINKRGPFEMVEETKQAVKDVVKSASNPDATKATVLDAAGDAGEAAITKATTELTAERVGKSNPTQRALDSIFSVWRNLENTFKDNKGTASRELFTRIMDQATDVRVALEKAILTAQKVERLPGIMADEAVVRAIKDAQKDAFPGLRNTILDIPEITYEAAANVRYAKMILGRPDGELFTRKIVADSFRRVHGLMDFEPVQRGQGWVLEGWKPINETSDVVRNAIGVYKTPEHWLTTLLGSKANYRTADAVSSLAQRYNAKAATYAPSVAFSILQKNAKDIKALKGWSGYNNKRWNDLIDVMKAAQDMPDNMGKPGKFFDSIGDFQDYFYRSKQVMPDDQQVAAYFAFVRGMEIDRIYRNIAEHRFKTRVGAESHKVSALGPDGKRIYADDFDGVLRQKMVGGTDAVAILGKNVGDERVSNIATMAAKDWEALDAEIRNGTKKLVEIYDPERRPLNGFGHIQDEYIRYVITDRVETHNLNWEHVMRRGGGHVEYDYSHYIKQAKIVDDTVGETMRKNYEGDTTIMPIAIRAMGEDVAKHLDIVRQFLKEKDETLAKVYAQANLPMEWKEIKDWFHPKKIDGKFIGARLNLNEKIQVVPRGKTIMDIDNELVKKYEGVVYERGLPRQFEFKDRTTQGSLARQYQVQYTQERDAEKLFTLVNEGTREAPLYKVSDVDKVDPISTMNRGLNRIASSNYLDDYKTFAVEHWLKEAAEHLDVKSLSDLKYAPFKYFKTPVFLSGTEPATKAALMGSHAAIDQLVGTPSKTDSWVNMMNQKLVDSIYTKGGEKAATTALDFLSSTSNPIEFTRSAVFHTKLGFWNVSQFLAQSMTYTNIWGIAPQHAPVGTWGAQLYFWSTLNGHKPIMEHMDKLASKLYLPGTSRYKPGEFLEAAEEGQKTGFLHVGAEARPLDNPYSNKLINTPLGSILESGSMFFQGGERNGRSGAWFVAMKEFRDKNPTAKITNEVRAQILERADILNNNMSHASNSALHTGAMSIPTQFYTYQLRASELLMGNRITTAEKARLVAINMLAYGIPTGAGISGLPISDAELPYIGGLRTWAKDNGYKVGEHFWSTIAMEGLPSYAVTALTGKEYNFGDRLGAKGLENFNTMIRGDKTILEILAGPAGGLVSSVWEATDGFWAHMMSMYRNDETQYKFTGKHYLNLLKEISTVNAADGLWTSLNTGVQMSKKGTPLSDVDSVDAFVKFFTGIQPQKASDIQRMLRSTNDLGDKYERGKKWALREYQAGLQAQDAGNNAQAHEFFNNATHVLEMYGVPHEQYSDVWSNAYKSNETLANKVEWDWAINKVPMGKEQIREEYMRTELNKRKEKQ